MFEKKRSRRFFFIIRQLHHTSVHKKNVLSTWDFETLVSLFGPYGHVIKVNLNIVQYQVVKNFLNKNTKILSTIENKLERVSSGHCKCFFALL